MAEMEEAGVAWRQLLDQELALQHPPPLSGLVEQSMLRGRKLRRARAVRRAGLGVTALLVASLGVWGITPRLFSSATTGPTPAAGSTSAFPGPTGELRPATSAAMAVLLRDLLPSGFAMSRPRAEATTGGLSLIADVNDGHSTGMIIVRLTPGSFRSDRCTSSECHPIPGGTVAIDREAGNCVQALVVSADRNTGTIVSVQVASCLGWNGSSNEPARMALDEQQATALASDRRWGSQMEAGLVEAGQREFPHLATKQGS